MSQRRKILIADDAEINRDMLAVIFEEEFEVIMASDGKEAMRRIREFHEELAMVFLDIVMPKMTGLEVLLAMKEEDYLEDIPVLIITGEGGVESDLKAYELGATAVMYKPFSRKIIENRTKNIMKQYAGRRTMEWTIQEMLDKYQKARDGEYGEVSEEFLHEMELVYEKAMEAMKNWD